MPGCLTNDRTQNLMIRMYTQTNPNMLDFENSFPTMVTKNIFTFCRDLYQNRLRSFSISYVFTCYLDYMWLNSLKHMFLNLAIRIILNLLHTKWKFKGKEGYDASESTNKLFAIDELKLGFFFQHSSEYWCKKIWRKVST